jgi:hypothetical protein
MTKELLAFVPASLIGLSGCQKRQPSAEERRTLDALKLLDWSITTARSGGRPPLDGVRAACGHARDNRDRNESTRRLADACDTQLPMLEANEHEWFGESGRFRNQLAFFEARVQGVRDRGGAIGGKEIAGFAHSCSDAYSHQNAISGAAKLAKACDDSFMLLARSYRTASDGSDADVRAQILRGVRILADRNVRERACFDARHRHAGRVVRAESSERDRAPQAGV